MFKRIDHIEIVVKDLEKSIKFYTEILNFNLKSRHQVGIGPLEEIVYLTLGDTMLELMKVKVSQAASAAEWLPGYRMMAIEVEDMDKATEYLKTKGVEITWGPMDLGGSKRAEIKDPDGNSIELRQW